MQLIGMLDSPYVRRVAISLQLLGLPFEHRPVSVFRQFDDFAAINPVVKAPSLVCDDGEVLMESSLILAHAEAVGSRRSLVPKAARDRQHDLRLQGLALAACEKAVQILYEGLVRPAEKRHEPWLQRVHGQLAAACRLLDDELARRPIAATSLGLTQGGVSTAVMWRFVQAILPSALAVDAHPALMAHSHAAEQLAEFSAWPHS